MMYSILAVEVARKEGEGWEVVTIGKGAITPDDKRSKLYKDMEAAEKLHKGKKIAYVVGGKAAGNAVSYHYAIMVKK